MLPLRSLLAIICLGSTVHALNLNRIYGQEVLESKSLSQSGASSQFLCAQTHGCISVPIFLWLYCCDFCISEVITCTTFPAPLWCYMGFFGWCLLHANVPETLALADATYGDIHTPQYVMAYLTCPGKVYDTFAGRLSTAVMTQVASYPAHAANWCLDLIMASRQVEDSSCISFNGKLGYTWMTIDSTDPAAVTCSCFSVNQEETLTDGVGLDMNTNENKDTYALRDADPKTMSGAEMSGPYASKLC